MMTAEGGLRSPTFVGARSSGPAEVEFLTSSQLLFTLSLSCDTDGIIVGKLREGFLESFVTTAAPLR